MYRIKDDIVLLLMGFFNAEMAKGHVYISTYLHIMFMNMHNYNIQKHPHVLHLSIPIR